MLSRVVTTCTGTSYGHWATLHAARGASITLPPQLGNPLFLTCPHAGGSHKPGTWTNPAGNKLGWLFSFCYISFESVFWSGSPQGHVNQDKGWAGNKSGRGRQVGPASLASAPSCQVTTATHPKSQTVTSSLNQQPWIKTNSAVWLQALYEDSHLEIKPGQVILSWILKLIFIIYISFLPFFFFWLPWGTNSICNYIKQTHSPAQKQSEHLAPTTFIRKFLQNLSSVKIRNFLLISSLSIVTAGDTPYSWANGVLLCEQVTPFPTHLDSKHLPGHPLLAMQEWLSPPSPSLLPFPIWVDHRGHA